MLLVTPRFHHYWGIINPYISGLTLSPEVGGFDAAIDTEEPLALRVGRPGGYVCASVCGLAAMARNGKISAAAGKPNKRVSTQISRISQTENSAENSIFEQIASWEYFFPLGKVPRQALKAS